MKILNALKERELPGFLNRFTKDNGNGGSGQEEDIHMGEPGFLKKLLRKKELEGLFLFVTSRCNSKCRTCFYASELNKKDDMKFEEIEKISRTAPIFDKLWLSGGEPFLRKELPEIIEAFYRNNKVKSINLPTNGLLADRIDEVTGQLLDKCPELTIHLNFSLDGLGETHDRVRGVPGSFKKTIDIMDRMEAKFGGHPRLHRNVATVVTREAYDEMLDLGAYLLQKRNCCTHFFETVRGTPRDPDLKVITRGELEDLHRKATPLYEEMAERMFASFDPRARWFAKLFFTGVIRFMFQVQEENLEGPKPWSMPCTAGETTIVIDHNGAFRSCELRPRIGRMQDYDFNLGAAFGSDAMKQEIEAIGGGKKANCWCTHGCWILSSMQFSPRTLLLDVPWSYLKHRPWKSSGYSIPHVDVTRIEGYRQTAQR
jgi:Fe-coproporphyrin III synthase